MLSKNVEVRFPYFLIKEITNKGFTVDEVNSSVVDHIDHYGLNDDVITLNNSLHQLTVVMEFDENGNCNLL